MSGGHRIVFMGTPDFAVASLDALFRAGHTIAGVVTAPDKPAGRGMKPTESAVKKYAVDNGLNLLQPERLKNPEFIEQLKSLHANLQLVVAFRMLPEMVWNMPHLGTINLHGSLLPQYRGAAPINWAIINGEYETGVTTFKLQHEIDTGNILLQETISIGNDETAGELHDRMKETGAALLVKTVQGIFDGSLQDTPQATRLFQPEHTLKHAPKIYTETCQINWSLSCNQLHNHIRGLSPYPGALTVLNSKVLKVYRSEKEIILPGHLHGQWVTDHKTYLKCACADGYIHVTELQLEGKKKCRSGIF